MLTCLCRKAKEAAAASEQEAAAAAEEAERATLQAEQREAADLQDEQTAALRQAAAKWTKRHASQPAAMECSLC